MAKFFELGPDEARGFVFAGHDRKPYVRLSSSSLRSQKGSDLLVSRECGSFEELQDEIALMKSDLDQILIEGKERFTRK